MTTPSGVASTGSVRRLVVAMLVVGMAVTALILGGVAASPAAAAVDTAPAITQCNPPDFPIIA
ncbi:MAG TPA: hypothetical protein VFC03_07510, partial [Acidimicrobiales bacterium]|nr:hypothetical protein [Acidimicrobiales bacterium]